MTPSHGNVSIARGRELTGLALVFLVFFVLNFSSLTRLPTPMMDEAIDTDVAAHLFRGLGYVSHADPISQSGRFLIAHPAYHILLAGWFNLTGFGVIQSRLFDVALAATVGFFVWVGAHRRYAPEAWLPRLLAVALFLMAEEFTRSYRGHRYDFLSALWLAAVYAGTAASHRRFRLGITLLMGFLLPLTSINGVAVFGLVLAWQLIRKRAAALPAVLAGGIGLALGLAFYAGLLASYDQLAGLFNQLTHFATGEKAAKSRWEILRAGIAWAPSCLPMALLAIVLFLRPAVRSARRHGLIDTLAAILVVPLAFSVTGHYSFYYTWTAVGCVSLLLLHTLSQAPLTRHENVLGIIFLGYVIASGLPLRVAKVLPEWKERDLAVVTDAVESTIRADDVVLTDAPAAHYAVAARAKEWFFATYRRGMCEADRNAVTLVILDPAENARPRAGWKEQLFAELGGQWDKVNEYAVPRGAGRSKISFAPPATTHLFELEFYRRASLSRPVETPHD